MIEHHLCLVLQAYGSLPRSGLASFQFEEATGFQSIQNDFQGVPLASRSTRVLEYAALDRGDGGLNEV